MAKTLSDRELLAKAHDLISGMTWTLDGVHGTLRVVRHNGMTEIEHEASFRGRLSANYRDMKRKLGDDYVTTLDQGGEDLEALFAAVWPRVLAAVQQETEVAQ